MLMQWQVDMFGYNDLFLLWKRYEMTEFKENVWLFSFRREKYNHASGTNH